MAEIAPDSPIERIGTVPEIAGKSRHILVVIARLLLGFAALGLVLAATGRAQHFVEHALDHAQRRPLTDGIGES